jgi:hypothetical protein
VDAHAAAQPVVRRCMCTAAQPVVRRCVCTAAAGKWKGGGFEHVRRARNKRNLCKFHSPRGCVMELFHPMFSGNK